MIKIIKRYVDKLKSNSFWNSVLQLSFGQIAAQVINVICVPILSRIYLTDDYGQLSIIVSMANIITGFVCLGMNSAMMLAETENEAKETFVVSQNIHFILAGFATVMLTIISFFQPVLHTTIPTLSAFTFVYAYIVINARNTLLSIYLNRIKKNNVLMMCPIINASSNLLIAIPLGLLGLHGYGLIIAAIIPLIVSNIIMSRHAHINCVRLKWSVYKDTIKKYRDLVTFQYPSNLVTSLSTQTPSQILASAFGESALGSYSMCEKIFHIPFTMLATPIQTVYFRTASKMTDKIEQLADFTYSLVKKIIYIAMLPTVITILWGETIFGFVLGSAWQHAGKLAAYLIVAYVFLFANNCITYCRVSIGKAKINLYTSMMSFTLMMAAIVLGTYLLRDLNTTIIAFAIANTLYGIVNLYITMRCLGKYSGRIAMVSLAYLSICIISMLLKYELVTKSIF